MKPGNSSNFKNNYMDAKSLALLLDGRQYRDEIDREQVEQAKESGLIVVFGASDDLIEFRGAIDEEEGAWEGGYYMIVKPGEYYPYEENEDTFKKADRLMVVGCENEPDSANVIKAIWDTKTDDDVETSWKYTTHLPKETFNIFDGEDHYCVGIIIDVKDLK